MVFFIFVVCIVTYQAPVFALNWTLNPKLNIKQTYSDNINLSNINKASALVTEISPGISVNGSSPISTFDLNYNLQALYNAQGGSETDFHNQLQMNTKYELIQNRLFMDSSSSISQQNNSNRQIAGDNIAGNGNSSTISTFMLSPYWTPHFKNFADGEFRLTYDRVSSEQDEGRENTLSDSNSFSQNISLNSGQYFSLFSWSLSFNNSEQNNQDGKNITFQDSQLEVRYAIGRKFSVFARGGHSSNSFSTNSDSNSNGTTYTLGGQWKPSQRLRIEAGYGNNRFVTVEISPFRRLHWITTYSNNDIGLNTGSRWDTRLNYNTRRTNWGLSYSEDTVTTQQLLLEQQVLDNTGLFDRNTGLPTLTDEVFITKTFDISFSFQSGKSNISANAYKTFRTFELSNNDEDVTGVSASWNWNFISQTSSNLQIGWQKTESDGLDSFSDKRFNFSASLTRNILSRLNGSIEYRFVDQSSSDAFNQYSENRITANLSLTY